MVLLALALNCVFDVDDGLRLLRAFACESADFFFDSRDDSHGDAHFFELFVGDAADGLRRIVPILA